MAFTYTPISTQTLGSATSSVTFSSIPSTYTDLVLIFTATKDSGTVVNPYFRVNGDTGNNYSYTRVYGDGTTAGSDKGTNASVILLGELATSPIGTTRVNFMNYSNTTTYKTTLTRSDNTSYNTNAIVGLWRSTSAINSITALTLSGSFATGSIFTLYGIQAA